jgi:hypothetical protein
MRLPSHRPAWFTPVFLAGAKIRASGRRVKGLREATVRRAALEAVAESWTLDCRGRRPCADTDCMPGERDLCGTCRWPRARAGRASSTRSPVAGAPALPAMSKCAQ